MGRVALIRTIARRLRAFTHFSLRIPGVTLLFAVAVAIAIPPPAPSRR